MKLTGIELHNFLSHGETRFEPNGARLLSIVGANGAGKSSLLDGVLYSLYDAARGKTDQLVRLGESDMSATVTFEYAGATYRVTRGRTTRSGGKTYLELAIADGETWRPLTGEDIRSTQAAIEQLLGLDAQTFTSAAFLRQGEADAFTSATPADRKRVLGTVLGLDVYAYAEARARELARDLDARQAIQRGHLERLEATLAGVNALEVERNGAEAELAVAEASIATERANLTAIDARIHELDVSLAAVDALAGQVEALEADRIATGDAWRRATGRLTVATQAIADAERIRAGAADVAAAVAELPAARGHVEALVGFEAEDRRLAAENRAARQALQDLERPYDAALTAWSVRYDAASEKVVELEAHGRAGRSVCEACGQPIEQKIALEQFAAARAALAELVATKPAAPIAIARARASLVRIEVRQRELDWDPGAMIAAQAEVTRLSSIAARGEAMAAAQATFERAIADRNEAEAERAQLADKGAAIAARIEGLRSELERAAPIRAERSAAGGARERAIVVLDELDSARRQLERAIAGADAKLEQLAAAAADAVRIREDLVAGDTELGRLRRLVAAFGVTGIPARIIAGVLPELAGYANELLGELRPGMTLELRAQRAKKSGDGVVEALDLIVRDPAGERPLVMYSGGERMSVSLAIAVALSRLVARRAGARISSLVVDEPDGLDSEARRAFGIALRTIAHRGELERVVLVSHHADLAEYADEVYSVTKGPTGSVVELVT